MTREPVGSLAEEAAKLVAALTSMSGSPSGGGRAESAEHVNDGEHTDHEDHDPLSTECRYCPICAVARTAKSVTPEVREHLMSAAASLLLALKGFLDEAAASASAATASPVEKIDLAED
jgi:hypothetical protein